MLAAVNHYNHLVANSVMAEISAVLSAPAEKAHELHRLRVAIEKGRAGLKLQADELDQAYEEIAQSELDPPTLLELAKRIIEQKRADGKWLYPTIERLRRKLTETDAEYDIEIRRAVEEMLDVFVSWLALFQDFHDRLRILADQRRAASGEILRARPVAGDIDHEALTREIVARFPKILAALAK